MHKTKSKPHVVVRLPRRRQIHVCYTLIVSSGETFGPFKSEQQAVLFAAVRWPKDVPAWHIEKHGYEI
jgi:hypothetical protein